MLKTLKGCKNDVENDAKMLVFGQKGDVSAKILSKKDSV